MKLIRPLSLALLIFICTQTNAQVGIGTNNPLASAQLDITSTTKGFLPPRMTRAERDAIASPANGLIIYNTSTKSLDLWSGSVWITFGIGLGNATNNLSLGYKSLYSNTTGNANVSIGYEALSSNTSGHNNIAAGYQTLASNTSGWGNIASGSLSLQSNTTGYGNVSLGYNTLMYNTTGNNNFAAGQQTMVYNSSGTNNVALGYQSMLYNSTGGANVAVGYQSMTSNSTGTNNTAIGATADVASSALTNATAIGYGAVAASSNSIRLGNTNVTNVATSGTITAGSVTYPNTAGTSGYYLTTNGTNTASWASLPINAISAFVGRGTDVTLGNLKVRLSASGNASLQLSTVSGTYSVFGSSTKVSTGVIGASRIDGATPFNVTTTPDYLSASDNFMASGDTSTWIIIDPTASISWRITLVIGAAYNNSLISIEKLH